MSELLNLSIKDIHQKLTQRDFSATELTEAFIAHVKKTDPEIHAYLAYHFDGAQREAKRVDEKIQRGDEIPLLAGVPAAIKDNMLVKGTKATAASKILENYVASYDAHVIEKLKNQDAVLLGKTNMDEFAMGSSTENSAFFKTKNPRDVSRVPGGSSGGSAAAVASKQAVYALGSDTGGSIRQPASFCGVVGLKPTYGAVSRFGLMAMASSLDQIGPLAKSVEDAEVVFEVIRGKDPRDATSIKFPESAAPKKLKGMKVGVPKEYFIEGMESGVKKAIEKSVAAMGKEGARVTEISLPHTKYAISSYYIVMPAEVSSNVARYDGIRYGYSTYHAQDGDNDLRAVYERSRTDGFGKEVKRRIMLGTYVLSAGYYDAYYKKAQQVRTKIKEDFKNAFTKVDVIATPTSPTVAFRFGEKTQDPLSMYLADVFTVPVNLAGVPAMSLPCGTSEGLPVGLQLIAPWFGEPLLFSVGKEVEEIVT